MRLTQWSDYTLRVLMYCAACQDRPQPVTITEISEAHNISRSHLTKVVFAMSGWGWLSTSRGRGGGIRLAKGAAEFNLEDVIRQTESDFTMVECFEATTNQCGLSAHCVLKGVLWEATQSYLAVLRRYTLADLVQPLAHPQTPAGAPAAKAMAWSLLIPGIPLHLPAQLPAKAAPGRDAKPNDGARRSGVAGRKKPA